MGFAMILGGCGKSTTEKVHEAVDGSVQAAVLYNQQNYSRALSEIQKAISINTELRRDSALGENYLLLAHCQRMLGAYDSSLDAFKRASDYFHLFGDQRLERRGRIALAELSYGLHRYGEALTIAAAAASEGKVFSDSANTFAASLLVAKIYHKLRNFTKEIATLRDILSDPFLQRGGESKQDLLRMQFEAVRGTGNIDSLQAFFDEWRNSYTGADSGLNAAAYVAWGHVQESLGHADLALRVYSRALNLLGGRRQRDLQAEVLTALGSLSYRGKRYDNARLYYTDAQTLAKEESNIILEQSLNLMLVACDWKLAGARPTQQMSKEFEKKCSDVAGACAQAAFLKGEAFAYTLKGLIAERRSDSAAVQALKEALKLNITNVIQADEDRSATDDLERVILDAEGVGLYDPMLRILGSSSNAAGLFAYAEERNLRDIEEFFSRLSFTPSDTALAAAIGAVTLKRNALQLLESDIVGELAGGKLRNLERFETLKDLLPQRLTGLAGAVSRIEGSNYRWLLFPKTLTLRMVRDTLAPKTGVLEYIPLENQTLILVVTRDTVILRSSGVGRGQLLASVREYTRLIGDARMNSDAPMFNAGAAERRMSELEPVLYSWLVDPVISAVAGLSKVFIVPPVEFGFLPFHTLRPSGSSQAASLVTRTDICYLPTAAALFFSKLPEEPVRDIVGFGHPGNTDWDVEYEVRDVRGFFDKARMYFDTAATLGNLSLATCDLLHLAASFTLHADLPDSTGMFLSDGLTPDGYTFVPLGAFGRLPAPKTLVFSNINPDPGGLWRYPALAMLAAGSQTVILTMWQGERKPKKDFGEGFYTHLMQGIPSSVSYHEAMLALTKNEDTPKSYQWGLYYKFGR